MNEPTPNRKLFWLITKWLAFAAVLFLVVRLLVMPFFFADKLIGREVQKFDAETSAQVYDNSRAYNQGINRDVARYCREWAEAPEGGKKALADLIASTADTFQGEWTPTNAACLNKIGYN